MDTATMLRYDERIKTENSAAELWNDRHFRDKEDEAGPAMTGLELAKDQHHPRSSLPHYYGYSLHTSKSVTGIDLRGAASV